MTDYLPPLRDGLGIGELANKPNDPTQQIWTYVQTPIQINANFIGFYFQGYTGNGIDTNITCNIRVIEVTEIFPWANPEDYDTLFGPGLTIASGISLSTILSGGEGWKGIPISNTSFVPGHLYVLAFDCETTLPPGSENTDAILIAQTNKASIPPGDRPHTLQKVSSGGRGYAHPIAISLTEDGVPECPEGYHWEAGNCVETIEEDYPLLEITNLDYPNAVTEGIRYNINTTMHNLAFAGMGFIKYHNLTLNLHSTIQFAITAGGVKHDSHHYDMGNTDQDITIEIGHNDMTGEVIDQVESFTIPIGFGPPGEGLSTGMTLGIVSAGIVGFYLLSKKK